MRNTTPIALALAFAALLSTGALAADTFDGFAVVNADGSVARAMKGVLAGHNGTGAYTVVLPGDIKTCAYSVTAGAGDASVPVPAVATAVMKPISFGPPRVRPAHTSVLIATYDHAGQPIDAGFHLVVQCEDRAPDATAVVDADGTLERGLNMAAAARVDTGSYLVTPDNGELPGVCAYTAAIGLSGSSGTSDPGFVTVAQGETAGQIAVRTYDETGTAADLGFQMIVTCPP
jgi:hypothetical protein